jgi:hypothetical protein
MKNDIVEVRLMAKSTAESSTGIFCPLIDKGGLPLKVIVVELNESQSWEVVNEAIKSTDGNSDPAKVSLTE